MRNVSLWKTIDWSIICVYVILVIMGWFSICGASYDFGEREFFDFSTRAGKQFIWIVCSLGLGFVLLMLEDRFYKLFSYVIYGAIIALLILTIFIAPDVKGSRSWLVLGPVSLQPAEFAKFATALALAKYMNSFNFNMKHFRSAFLMAAIVFLPMVLIICQRETGSALVYFAFFLVFYREGMPGVVLFSGICAVLYFVLSIRFGEVYIADTPTPIGEFVVLSLIIVFSSLMLWAYQKNMALALKLIGIAFGVTLIAYIISEYVIHFNLVWVLWGLSAALVGYLLFLAFRKWQRIYLLISIFTIGSIAFTYSSDYVFDDILEAHQQIRIKVLLGMEDDPTGAGYNVNQSKIAIGSGGFSGKGFLNGTQTKLKYVPEQDTDFIFCTIGEEQGFIGSSVVLLLFLVLLLRLIYLAARPTSTFWRVYGDSVGSFILFLYFITVLRKLQVKLPTAVH